MTYAEPENVTSMTQLFSYADSVSGGVFSILLLLSLYIIVFAYLKNKGEEVYNSMIVAGFITTFSSVFMFMMGLIDNYVLMIVVVLFVLSLILSYLSKD